MYTQNAVKQNCVYYMRTQRTQRVHRTIVLFIHNIIQVYLSFPKLPHPSLAGVFLFTAKPTYYA